VSPPAPGKRTFVDLSGVNFSGATGVNLSPRAFRQGVAERAGLEQLLIELVERCRRQAPGLVLVLNTRQCHAATVDPQEADTLRFALCEIVANAYRFAHPDGHATEVTIEGRASRAGEIVIEIGDDGVGLSPDFAEWRDSGHGMLAVRARMQDIQAVLNVTSDDLGLRFQIILHRARRARPNPARGNFVWL
jgi:signal transduction histidine kinase